MVYMLNTVLKGISDGLSRGKKPDEMEKLVVCHIIFSCCLLHIVVFKFNFDF